MLRQGLFAVTRDQGDATLSTKPMGIASLNPSYARQCHGVHAKAPAGLDLPGRGIAN
ncbi:hypothetical protein D9M68_173250 [compost metagenome]